MAIYIMGDIHGYIDAFDAILARISPSRGDVMILLGDMIDRGPDSAGVIKRCLQHRDRTALITIRGNHEELLLDARGNPDNLRMWMMLGGQDTLRSYGGPRATLRDIPPEHLEFIEQSRDYYEVATHIFVHAGLEPRLPLNAQTPRVMHWRVFDNPGPHISGKVMVCGHTPQENGRPRNIGHAICLDTGIHCGGKLSCLELDSGKVLQADQKGNITVLSLGDCID